MVKHTQIIQQQIADELFECVDHFVGLALKGLKAWLGLECTFDAGYNTVLQIQRQISLWLILKIILF